MARIRYTGANSPFDQVDIPDLRLVGVKRGDEFDVDDEAVVDDLLAQGNYERADAPAPAAKSAAKRSRKS